MGLGDDAAVVRLPAGSVGVHTVDVLRALVDDVYTFGAIAANHALGDCYAMGAEPLSALAIATVPYGLDDKVSGHARTGAHSRAGRPRRTSGLSSVGPACCSLPAALWPDR